MKRGEAAMISIEKLEKKFGDKLALNGLDCTIPEGSIYGLVGSNGSGKSTLLRTLSGVYKADGGRVLIDGEDVFDNPVIKDNCYFISDYPFFYSSDTLAKLAEYNKLVYSHWDYKRFYELCDYFKLDTNAKIINMSKGMQRQVAIIVAFATNPKYMFLDEIFDGLDPVIRMKFKKLIIDAVTDRNMTFIIASHNLREIDDVCNGIIMIHSGELVTKGDSDYMKDKFHKIQIAIPENVSGKQCEELFEKLDVQVINHIGSYYLLMIQGNIEEIENQLNTLNPVFMEIVNATLEEVFISEMEGVGYGE